MLWPEQGLTFTFCSGRDLRLKWATGNNLQLSSSAQPVGSGSFNLLGGIKKVRNWFKGR